MFWGCCEAELAQHFVSYVCAPPFFEFDLFYDHRPGPRVMLICELQTKNFVKFMFPKFFPLRGGV